MVGPPFDDRTVSVKGALLTCPTASETRTTNAVPPAEPRDGVPLTTPPADMLAQAGNPLAEKEYGVVPPDALNAAENASPTVAWSAEVVVTDSTGSMDKLNAPLARFPAASVTVIEKLYDPADPPAGGVPLNRPAVERLR